MRHRHTFLIVAGALCLGLLGTAYRSRRERDELRLQQSAATARNASLQTELRRAVQAATARSAARVEPSAAPPAPESQAATPPPRPILRAPGLIDLARDNPGLWNEFVNSKKSEVSQRYGPLFQSLGLSTEQRARFKEIMAAGTTRSADIAAAADAQQLARTDPAVAALRDQSEKQTQTELVALLGERSYAELKEYDRTIPVRGLADGLAVQLAAVEPLSAKQADGLTRALATASAAFRKGGYATSADVDWASVDEEAKAILTPAQFAIWQQGTAHNLYGGSRQDVELRKLYEQTVKATKPAGGG